MFSLLKTSLPRATSMPIFYKQLSACQALIVCIPFQVKAMCKNCTLPGANSGFANFVPYPTENVFVTKRAKMGPKKGSKIGQFQAFFRHKIALYFDLQHITKGPKKDQKLQNWGEVEQKAYPSRHSKSMLGRAVSVLTALTKKATAPTAVAL